MQTFIAILSTIGSLLGIIGLFGYTPLFFIGGIVGFLGLLIYGESMIRIKEQSKLESYATNLPNQEQKDIAQKNIRRIMIGSRIITAIVLTIIFLIFKLYGICWIGIIFGLLFIPELLGKLIKRTANSR